MSKFLDTKITNIKYEFYSLYTDGALFRNCKLPKWLAT